VLGADQPLVQPDKVRQAGVFIGNFDSCTNTMLLSANGSYAVDKNSFQVSSQLTLAELTTSLNVHDFVSTSALDVSVDMTWVEAGTLLRIRTTFTLSRPEIRSDLSPPCQCLRDCV
jgi:hypothetical protein